jgi:hypothetical protein
MSGAEGSEPRSEDGSGGEAPREPPPGSGDPNRIAEHVSEIAEHVSRLVRLRIARSGVRMSRVLFLAFGGVLLLLVCATTSLAGALYFVRGLNATLTEVLGGRAWLAELASGILLLAGMALLLVSVQAWSERRMLREFVKRHGRKPSGQ